MPLKKFSRHCWISITALTLVSFAQAHAGEMVEPQSYWIGQMQGDVPATIAHGHVVHADSLADLIARGSAVLIDAAELPRRPPSLAPDAVWKPAVHRNIPGSIWLPGIGKGALDADGARVFEARLAALTQGDLDKAIVVYCHQHCWSSWNAAKRAISFGYRNVNWYPEGVEGWQDSNRELVASTAEILVQNIQ
jgi:PQQ-dependent catabolism-associated CXXCW motif protein